MTDETTNPSDVSEVEDVLEEGAPEEEYEGGEGEGEEAEGSEEEQPEVDEPETVEIERDGKKYRIPAELKDDLLRQADYTRKTQEVAEQRKALESALSEFQQASEAETNAKAALVAIDAVLEQYKAVDWDAWVNSDPQGAQAAWIKYQQLIQNRTTADEQYRTARTARETQAQRELAKRIELGTAELQRAIPDWSADKAKAILSVGTNYGFSTEELSALTDHRAILVLHDAMKWREQQATAKKAAKVATQQQIKPAAKVKGKPTAAPAGLDDRLSADEWLRRRNEQLRKRSG